MRRGLAGGWLLGLMALLPAQSSAAEPLRVAAASDLQTAFPALAKAFHESGGVEVSATFGASGQLVEQIKAGAPFDVFLSANLAFVEGLAKGGDVAPKSVKPYAVGSLVLVVHEGSGGGIERLADLSKPAVKKVAIANPAFAPYGAAAKQALEKAGLWDELAPKRVQAETVRQALQFVQSGNAEAGLVGRSVAKVKGVRIVEVDPKLYDPIVQGLGIVARTKRPDDARAFADFLLGEKGQALLVHHGFGGKPEAR